MTNYESIVAVLREISPVLKEVGEIYNPPIVGVERIAKVTQQLSGISNISEMIKSSIVVSERLKNIQGIDFSQIKEVQKQINSMQTIVGSMNLEKSLYNLSANFTKVSKNYQSIIGFDYDGMMKALQNTLERRKNCEEFGGIEEVEEVLDEIAEEVQEEYEEIHPNKVATTKSKYELVKEVRDWINTILAIIGFIVAIPSSINTTPNITYNNSIKVNNYYVNDLEIDACYLNFCQYGIVNRDHVCPRVKQGCKSQVTGDLMEGQVVQKMDKMKKWIQISWQNENGDICYGWIQNYKISEFKNQKKKRK